MHTHAGVLIFSAHILAPHGWSAAGTSYFRESLTKLRIFELEEYARIIYLDADGLLWRNVDHVSMIRPFRLGFPFSNYSQQLQGQGFHNLKPL